MADWFVYIVRCSDNSLYTGITTDFVRRIEEHNTQINKDTRYTRSRRPVKLVYLENTTCRSEASKREYQIKQLTRADKLKLIEHKATQVP